MRLFLKAIRIHQWAKNILIFIPLLAAHKILEISLLRQSLLAFISFSLCASAVYLLNDILDIDADRQHEIKKHRPLASGKIPLSVAKTLIPVFLVLSFLISLLLPRPFFYILSFYIGVTTAYSIFLKKLVLVDVMTLATLYTTRIFAGALAGEVEVSPWLLFFSMFLFTSLAFVKRFSELQILHIKNSEFGIGRGYMGKDISVIGDLGVASGYVSVLIMALYVSSDDILPLYARPHFMWFICPLLMYWISRVWLLTRRGEMHSDPILFAITDKTSYVIGALCVLIIFLAT
jgi:4-hydroxybenzoate polyprenyltransferase